MQPPPYISLLRLLDDIELNYRAACVLLLLQEKHTDNMSNIAHALGITAAGMTGIADKLHHNGYIYRTHNRHGDTRCNTLALTDKGRAIATSISVHLTHA